MIESINYNNHFKEIDFKDLVKIEIYSNRDIEKDGTKEEGMNIIKNNDMMQYHYFGQDYDIIKRSSYIAIFSIIKNNIKHYIGFVALKTPNINKVLRNLYFGSSFLAFLYKEDKFQAYLISRMVILPSFRGMGLSKYLLDELSNKVKDYIDYIEISSVLLNTIDFIPESYNKTFLKIEKSRRKELFSKFKNLQGNLIDFKEGVEELANIAFKVLNKEKLKKLYIKYLNEKYNVKNEGLNIDNIDDYFNKILILDNISLEDLWYFRRKKIPLILLHNNKIEDVKKLRYVSKGYNNDK